MFKKDSCTTRQYDNEIKPDGEFLRGIRHEPLNRRESWLV